MEDYTKTNRERSRDAQRRRQRVHGRSLITVIDRLEREREDARRRKEGK